MAFTCTLKPPDNFSKFSTARNEKQSGGKFYDVVYGKLDDAWTEQAFIYGDGWTEEAASNHCLLSGGTMQSVDGTKALPAELSTRAAALRPSSLDEQSRTVRVVIATSQPVKIADPMRGLIDEVLLPEGWSLPPGRDRVPLIDSHDRSTSRAVIGSVLNIHVEAGQVVGLAEISKAADDVFQKIREGHLTDVSIGYQVNEDSAEYIDRDETRTVGSQTVKGPAKIVKQFLIKEVSAVPIGADTNAQIRKDKNMTITDEIKNKNDAASAVIAERERISNITAMCQRYNFPQDQTRAFIETGASWDDARQAVLDWTMRNEAPSGYRGPGGPRGPATLIADSADKRRAAIVDGLCLRANVKIEKPAPGANEYRGASLSDIAKESLENAGVKTRGLTRDAIIDTAISTRAHTTSDFSNILADVANKTAAKEYQQAPATWRSFCQTENAVDFKNINSVRLSEGDDLIENHENESLSYGTLEDEKISYAVKRYGRLFAVSREALKNDSLNELLKVPRQYAASAARLVNQTVWDLLIDNGSQPDGVALFHATHANLVDSGGAPSLSEMNATRLLMRKQTGPQGAYLNVNPAFVLIPPSLETSTKQLLYSKQIEPAEGDGTSNPFYKEMQPVVEAYLESNSSVIWYLAADPGQHETINVAFLDGRETPQIDTREGWTTLGLEFRAYIEFAAAVIDYRGFVRNDGEA